MLRQPVAALLKVRAAMGKETVLRSPFIDKKSREQFEMRQHKRLVDILDPSQKTLDALTSLDLPGGLDIVIKGS